MLKKFIFSLSENWLNLTITGRGVFLIAFSFRWVCSLYVWTKFPRDAEQRGQNCSEQHLKKKTRSRNTTSQGTSLATRKIPLPVQDRDSCRPPFWRVFTSLFFFISLHLCTISLYLSSNEKLLKIPKQKLHSENVLSVSWHHFSGTHCRPL